MSRFSSTRQVLPVLALWLAGCEVPAVAPPMAEPTAHADQLLITATPRGREDVESLWQLAEHVLEPHAPEVIPHRLLVTAAALQALRPGHSAVPRAD